MSEQMSHLRSNHLEAWSYRSTSQRDLLEDSYDFALLGTSWDARCLAICATEIHCNFIQVLCPENRGSGVLRDSHDPQLEAWASTHSDIAEWVPCDTSDPEVGHRAIAHRMREQRKKQGRPLRILIDLSATARFYTLSAVALALNENMAESVDVLYAEGDYGEVISTGAVRHAARDRWETLAIPLLEGEWFPARTRHFLASVGFEGDQPARLAERWDPDSMSVLLPIPGANLDYDSRMLEANQSWMSVHLDASSPRMSAGHSDAVEAWRAAASQLDPESSNIYCLLCGTKPHSLGLTLWSLAQSSPAIMYVKPTTHQEQDIRENGVYWRYSVRDLSVVL